MNKYDSIADDDLSPEEILKQAQDAAKKAKDLLTTRKPKTDVSNFLACYLHIGNLISPDTLLVSSSSNCN